MIVYVLYIILFDVVFEVMELLNKKEKKGKQLIFVCYLTFYCTCIVYSGRNNIRRNALVSALCFFSNYVQYHTLYPYCNIKHQTHCLLRGGFEFEKIYISLYKKV